MKRFFLIPAWLCASLSLMAQDTLTVARCRELALVHNKTVQAARKNTDAALYTAKSYRANYFPKLSLNGGALYTTTEGTLGIAGGMLPVLAPNAALGGALAPAGSYAYFPGLDLDFKGGMMYNAGVQLMQPLYTGGKVRAAHRMALDGVEVARQNERLTDAQVIAQTDRAYADAVKARELQGVARAYHDLLTELNRNVESAVKHGLKQKNDRLKVQVKLAESELQLRQAENAGRLAGMNLCRLIGRPLDEVVTLSASYPEVPADELEALITDVTLRPEAAMLDAKVQVAARQVQLARSELLPQVALVGSYAYTHGLEVNNRTLLNGWDFSGGVAVSIPLWHFGEQSHKVKAARRRHEQAVLERADLNEQMRLELAQAVLKLDEARLEVELAEKSLAQAGEHLRQSRRGYDVGLEPLTDLLEAQVLWLKVGETCVDAHYRLYLGVVNYRRAAGLLTD